MGVLSPIEMRGPHSYYTVHFTLPHTLVPNHASLRLIYRIDPSLSPHTTSLHVSINGSTIATIQPLVVPDRANSLDAADIPVPDTLLVRNNSLTLSSQEAASCRPKIGPRSRFFAASVNLQPSK